MTDTSLLHPKLDRIPFHDPRSRAFTVREYLDRLPEERRMRGRTWSPGPPLDQSNEGACTGFGVTHRRNSMPVRGDHDASTARDVYQHARAFDREEGRHYPEGATVLAAMKAGRARGWWHEFRWIGAGSQSPIDDFVDSTIDIGPVVLGLDWKQGMFTPRPSGLLDCSGPVEGGHCLTGIGVRMRARLKGEGPKPLEVAVLQQSWGTDHGVGMFGYPGGFVFIKLTDLEDLLKNLGEGAVPIEV